MFAHFMLLSASCPLATIHRDVLYFLLHYIYLTVLVTLQIQINKKCHDILLTHPAVYDAVKINSTFSTCNIKIMLTHE